MNHNRSLWLALGLAAFGSLASAGNLSFTCDSSIDTTQAGTCSYLNNVVANYYTSTFSNVNASIYIQMGITGLGQSTTGYDNQVTYAQYIAGLAAEATASGNAIQASALTALAANDASVYGTGNVDISSALGTALGIGGLTGTTAGGASCVIGTALCYNGIITITTPANLFSETGQGLYWDQTGGTEPADDYDFYATVQHETDEILGTSSCIGTQGGSGLSDGCPGTGTPSAVDLFRYSGVGGSLVTDASLSTAAGALFSYNGGITNGANGFLYNTLANGDDYADFVNSCPSSSYSIQDATGCTGVDQGQTILNDGGAEVNILNAIGYGTVSVTTPEPGTMALFGLGLAALGIYRRRRA